MKMILSLSCDICEFYTYIHTYSFITSCQTQPYMRAEIAQPTAKTIVTQLQFVLY